MDNSRKDSIKKGLEGVIKDISAKSPRLVAVSKTFPAKDIMVAYDQGQRHFGENYVQELLEKCRQLPSDIQWHFIGALQSNKLKSLATIPNLTIETLDDERKAEILNKLVVGRKMPVFVQVNTSGEEQKHGVTPEKAPALASFIVEQCPSLEFTGLMTIGSTDASDQDTNVEFHRLVECQRDVAKILGRQESSIELSMGMSRDYMQAIKQGSTSIRVGSNIFGKREAK